MLNLVIGLNECIFILVLGYFKTAVLWFVHHSSTNGYLLGKSMFYSIVHTNMVTWQKWKAYKYVRIYKIASNKIRKVSRLQSIGHSAPNQLPLLSFSQTTIQQTTKQMFAAQKIFFLADLQNLFKNVVSVKISKPCSDLTK